MGRPRKPVQLHVIAGTDRPDRAPPPSLELPLVEAIPEPPSWLKSEHAVEEFKRLASILVANGLLTEAAQSPLAILCALHAIIVEKISTNVQPSGHLVAQWRGLCSEFGLMPLSQGRIKAPASPSKSQNRFAQIGRKA